LHRWWRDEEGRFAVIFPINNHNVTFVANAPVRFLEQSGLAFKVRESSCTAVHSWSPCFHHSSFND
jgi:hypothetical protein